MKPIKLRTKVEAVVILFLLIGITASAVTIKWGEDASGNYWSGLQDELITNSNGKAWLPTNANLLTAIYDLNNTGGVVYLPNATITITTSINISHDDVSLIGSGRNSVLYTADDINILELWGTANFPNDLRGVYIEKILFKGSAGHTSSAGIKMGRAHHCMIQECWFDTLYDGMNIGDTDDTDNNWFSNCHFQSITNHAMYFSARCQENIIIGNTMEPGTNADTGIKMQGVNNVIMGNTIEEVGLTSGTGDGIYLGGEENVCTGNTIRECGRYGIYLTFNTGVGNNTVTNNFIEDCESYGMLVNGQGHIISNNNIVNNVGYGIGITVGGKGVIVSGNHIGTHSVGYIYDATDNVTMSSNILDRNFEWVVTPENLTVNFTGSTWFNNAGTQILEISSSGSWSYIRGQENAGSQLRIQPGSGYASIDIYGSEDVRIIHDSGAGDATRIYEGATNIFTFHNDGTDNVINSTTGHVTIDDCLKLEPVASLPSNPVEGMICYYSTNSTLLCWTGAGWQGFW